MLIIQIQTGNEGLNLQDYNEIYIVTPSWNPKLEEQAIARCHRLGQKKEVFVFKFVMEDFGSVTFEAPQTPVYVVDKRKKKKRSQKLRRIRQGGVEEERDRVGEKRKRSDSDPADLEDEEDTLPGDNSEFGGENGLGESGESGESTEGRIYKRARKGGEDVVDYFFLKHSLLDDEEEEDYKEDIDTESPVETNMSKHYEQQHRVLLKFDSEWTGTSKNIEMYSEELQERKNQLEIDIGLTSTSG